MPPAKKSRLFRPSSADRIIICIGSTQLIRGLPPSPSSPEAREGTAAHSLMEMYFTGRVKDPIEMLGRDIQVIDEYPDPANPKQIVQTVYDITVDEEMVDAILLVIDVVEKRRLPDTAFLFEHEMDLSALDPTDPMLAENGGTADILIFNYTTRTIHVIDLKYGRGVAVASDAYQLKNYGVLALVNYKHPDGGNWGWVETVVVQPRMFREDDRVKPFMHKAVDIWGFLGTLYTAMVRSYVPNAPLTPSEKACRWCPGQQQLVCPAHAAAAMAIGASYFATGTEVAPLTPSSPMPITREMPELIEPTTLTPEQCAVVLDWREIWKKFSQAVEMRAVQYMRAGVPVRGYGLTQRTGHRKIINEDVAVTVLTAIGLSHSDLYQPQKMKSPAQLEKTAPPGKLRKAVIEALNGRPATDTLPEILPLAHRPLGDIVLVRSEEGGAPEGRPVVGSPFPALLP